jgi:hypothetical protein
MCILTKAGNPQVVHIYPYSLINKARSNIEKPTFWSLLQMFWSIRWIQEWRDEVHRDPQNPGTGTEGCFNLLCLAPHVHDWWKRGLFALNPVDGSEDRTTLTLPGQKASVQLQTARVAVDTIESYNNERG